MKEDIFLFHEWSLLKKNEASLEHSLALLVSFGRTYKERKKNAYVIQTSSWTCSVEHNYRGDYISSSTEKRCPLKYVGLWGKRQQWDPVSLFGKAFFYGTVVRERPSSGALIRTFNNLRKQFLLNMMNTQTIRQGQRNGEGLPVGATGLFTTAFCLKLRMLRIYFMWVDSEKYTRVTVFHKWRTLRATLNYAAGSK